MRAGSRLLVSLVLLSACGPDERAERDKVSAGVERIRALPANHAAEQKQAADELAALVVESPKAMRARDTCSTAYRTKASLLLLIDEVSARTAELKGTPPAAVQAELVEKMRSIDALQAQAESELPECSQAMSDLVGQ